MNKFFCEELMTQWCKVNTIGGYVIYSDTGSFLHQIILQRDKNGSILLADRPDLTGHL